MPKTVTLEITQSEKDAEFLRSLSKTSKLAAKCTYVGTFSGRFILCFEKHCGKYIYYAVDQITGRFSRVSESSFAFSESALAREINHALVDAVKYTGVFNRIKIPGRHMQSPWLGAGMG